MSLRPGVKQTVEDFRRVARRGQRSSSHQPTVLVPYSPMVQSRVRLTGTLRR